MKIQNAENYNRGWDHKAEGAPVPASHSFNVASSLPLRTVLPSGEKAQERTQSECPLSV